MHAEEPIRSPLTALRRFWWLGILLAMLGTAGGALFGAQRPVHITAETRVVVGAEEIAAYQVPAYAAASVQLAQNYARYVGVQVEAGRLDSILGRIPGLLSVGASPIPDSSVIRIEAVATNANAARRGAAGMATYLLKTVNSAASVTATADRLLGQYRTASRVAGETAASRSEAEAQLNRVVSSNQSASAVSQARDQLAQAVSDDATAQLQASALSSQYQFAVSPQQGAATLRLISQAAATLSDRRSTIQRYGAAGLLAGGVLALVLAIVLDRRRSEFRVHG